MVRYWGSWTATSSSGARYRLGIDYSVSGTKVTVDRYVAESEYSIGKSVTLTRTGALSGSYSVTFSTSGGVVDLGRGGSVTGSRGSSVSIGGRLTNVLHGLEPSFSLSIPIPALAPAKCAKPTVSNITAGGARGNLASAPAANGASITRYEWQHDGGSAVGNSGTTRNYTFTSMSAYTQYRVRVRAVNSAGEGAWSDWSSTFRTLPLAPTAPSAPTLTRTSDTSHRVEWSRTATATRPYGSQQVQRRTFAGSWGSWTTIATISGVHTTSGSHSYTDTSTVANRAYEYRIVASSSAGSAASAASVSVFTTPATPSAAAASKNASGAITVSWTHALVVTSYQSRVEHSTDGGVTWSLLATVAAGLSSYSHDDPAVDATHTYRVRGQINSSGSVGHGLASGWRTTGTVQLAAPPAAPTPLGPTGARDASEPITLTWRHNPVDSSEQTAFQLRLRELGESVWTTEPTLSSGEESWVLEADTYPNGVSVEWQVRTWGVHATASPWSSTSSVVLSSPPIVTLVDPEDGATWENPRLTIEWAYFDAEDHPQATFQAQLLDTEDEVVETRTGTTATSATFLRTLADGSQWSVRVRSQGSAGMWSQWAAAAITVDYPEPVPPVLSAVFQPDDGTIELGIENPEPTDGEPETVSNDIYRSIDGGEWLLIASDVGPNGVVVDAIPSIAGTNVYRAVAWSELPSTATSAEVAVEVADGWVYVNFGPAFTEFVRFYGNVTIGGRAARARALHEFAERRKPLQLTGPARSRSRSVAGRLTPEASTLDAVEEAFQDAEVAVLRDPKGNRMFGSLSELTHDWVGATQLISISFTITEVDHVG